MQVGTKEAARQLSVHPTVIGKMASKYDWCWFEKPDEKRIAERSQTGIVQLFNVNDPRKADFITSCKERTIKTHATATFMFLKHCKRADSIHTLNDLFRYVHRLQNTYSRGFAEAIQMEYEAYLSNP